VAERTDDAYRVIFALRANIREANEPGTITIAPDEQGWNDFGHSIRAQFTITPRPSTARGGMVGSRSLFLAFTTEEGEQADIRWLRSRIGNAAFIRQEQLPGFFTMLADLAGYRTIVEILGPSEARVALQAMHDVVEAGDSPKAPPWLRSAVTGPVFLSAFVRDSESYFAWKNAAPILEGLEFEEIGKISETLAIRFQLAGRPNPHELVFKFAIHDDILPKRFAIVIGKNGVGKSQTLRRIASAALSGNNSLTDCKGERPSLNRLLAFTGTAASGSIFPPMQRRGAKIWYKRFSLSHAGMGRRRDPTSDLIVQVARSNEGIGGRGRFEILERALHAIDGFSELALPSRDRSEPTLIAKLLTGGEQARIERFGSVDINLEPVRLIDGETYPLSSGELSFVRFAALASLYVENGSLLLFDEPETHLHPNFISQFVSILDNILEQTGSAAIIATHSAYFVREAFAEQVTVLRSAPDRIVEVEQPTLKTFGADVGAISYFVFGEDEPTRLARIVERRIAEQGLNWEQIFEEYKGDLSLELLSDLRSRLEPLGPHSRQS
jgi:ABC-type transport system involved in cytochrome c biogenesis ATPase subunit